jgi:hypothetical protein
MPLAWRGHAETANKADDLSIAFHEARQATVRLIALLVEVDSRKLYAGQGYSSLFSFCTRQLHLSEHAAYLRIEAARSVQRFPVILARLCDGSLHLTAVSLLAPHLTPANHVEVLDAATHKSKRDVELLVARLRPQPDVPSLVRKLPSLTAAAVVRSEAPIPDCHGPKCDGHLANSPPLKSPSAAFPAPPPAEIKPLTPERYKVQFTVSRETHDKLRRVQGLMRHTSPDGDPAAIFDRALTLLLAELSRTKFAATDRPQPERNTQRHSRHIPAAVKRSVWSRDGGQCAFRGERGRCAETGFLEFHHVVPYADGGETSAANLELRCRAHNQYEMDLWSGATQPPCVRESRALFG